MICWPMPLPGYSLRRIRASGCGSSISPKIYYMTQASVAPPTFVIFANSIELFHFSYQRYIENCLRETFGFRGTPVRIIIRERGEKE